MPDIDPAALSRQDSTTTITPSLSSKSLTINPPSSSKAAKAVQSTPRVDIEPLYTALKNAIGDSWVTYKNATGQFILGELSPEELSQHIEPCLGTDPQKEHLHNQLICGIYANLCRDAPENGVAPWVSANDKPTNVAKPAAGDGAEQRLKVEVMKLPPRTRHRLKHIQDEPFQPLIHAYSTQRESRYALTSTSTASNTNSTPSATTTPSTGLNTDLEIRKRYNAPLISETRDLPPTSALTDRLLPICYEEGLSSGPTNPALCADLLSTALENFIKETLGAMISRCITDAPVSAPTGVVALSSVERNAAATAPIDTDSGAIANGASPGSHSRADIHTNGFHPPTAGASTSTPPAPAYRPPDPPALRLSNPLTLGHGVAATSPPGILTATYKAQLAHEDALCARGALKRTDAGLLPCEVTAAKRAGRIGTAAGADDWRVSWEVGDVWLRSVVPWIGERVCAGEFMGMMRESGGSGGGGGGGGGGGESEFEEDAGSEDAEGDEEDVVMRDGADGVVVNGVVNGAAETITGLGLMLPPAGEDAMAVDDEADWGWQGCTKGDRGALASLLDDCLTVGQ